MTRSICLVGTAQSSFALAPYGNPEFEIWACSPGTMSAPRVDKLFELHRWEPGQPWFSDNYVDYLSKFVGDVIMTSKVDAVPNCKVLEWERLVKKFGPYNFTSSLAWMMAMAIEQEPDKIALYGVDMAATSEYHDQRMGCQYFAVLARQLGIEVGVPPESDLLRPPPLYGVCENSHAWIKQTARARELAGRLNQAQQEVQMKTQEVHFLQGAMDDQDWQLHSFFGGPDSMGQEFTEPPLPELTIYPSAKTNGTEPPSIRLDQDMNFIPDEDPELDTRPYKE